MCLVRAMVASCVALGVVLATSAGGYAYHRAEHHDAAVASGRPVFEAVPTRAPATEIVHHRICSEVRAAVGSGPPPAAHGLVWVDPDPVAGVAVWHPGMNTATCRARLTHLSAPQARAFAEAVDRAPAVPAGNYSCPADDASGVTVYLTYPHQRRAEVVGVDLLGCRWIDAPGRAARQGVALGVLGKEPAGLH